MHAALLIAVLSIGQFGPPAWGTPGAGSSPACGPDGCDQPEMASVGKSPVQRHPKLAAIVKVEAMLSRPGYHGFGSGTVYHRYENGVGLVVTNWHVVKDRANDNAVRVHFVQLGSGPDCRADGVVVEADEAWDVAVIMVQLPDGVEPVGMRRTLPDIGEPLTVIGYPGGRDSIFWDSGPVSQFMERTRGGEPYMVEARARCSQGCSGGPMIDSRGYMVAVLWGGDSQTGATTTGSAMARICPILDRIRDRLRGRLNPGQRRPSGRNGDGSVDLNPVTGKPNEPNLSQPALPGPATNVPPASPAQPPRESEPPQNPNGSGPSTGGELAGLQGLQGRLQKLEHDLAERLRNDAAAAKPAIVEEGKRLAGDAIAAAAPSLASKFLTLALTTAAGVAGIGLPVGGAAGAAWIITKLIGVTRRSLAARKAAKQGRNTLAGTMPAGGTDAPIFSPAVNPYQPPRVQARPPALDLPPIFVPTQVDDPHFVALKEALKTLGSEGPHHSHFVRRVYDFQKQLLARATT